MHKHTKRLLFLLLFFSSGLFSHGLFSPGLHALHYRTEFTGLTDKEMVETFEDVSQTKGLERKSVSSLAALRRRADDDVQKLNQAAHYHGYLSAKTNYFITHTDTPTVVFKVELGPIFRIATAEVQSPEEEKAPIIEELNGFLNKRDAGTIASTKKIVENENEALNYLKNRGYYFASLEQHSVVADLAHHTVTHTMSIIPGPVCFLGAPIIIGSGSVKDQKVMRCVAWKEGDIYSKEVIEKTYQALERSNLFSQISIHEGTTLLEGNIVPIEIALEEAPHKTVGAGISYMTIKGPGVALDWEHRNIRNVGEKLTLRAELWEKFQTLTASLQQQDLFKDGETLNWITEYDRRKLLAYDSRNLNFGAIYDKKVFQDLDCFFGARIEDLRSFSNRKTEWYYLVKGPLGLKYNTSNNILDPTRGNIVNIKLTPAYQFRSDDFSYLIHTTSVASFVSLPSDLCTFAIKVTFGNIIGASRNTIPKPDRFFSGSDNALRGYRYQSVSPLDKEGEPRGGRSLLTGSFETRLRTSSKLGWVLFFDIGNVYSANIPDLHKKQLRSVGLGARYNTPIGPLRADIAFPLDRRKGLDGRFQLYFSIGQAF